MDIDRPVQCDFAGKRRNSFEGCDHHTQEEYLVRLWLLESYREKLKKKTISYLQGLGVHLAHPLGPHKRAPQGLKRPMSNHRSQPGQRAHKGGENKHSKNKDNSTTTGHRLAPTNTRMVPTTLSTLCLLIKR